MGSMAQTGLLLVPSDALGHTWALPGVLGGGRGLPPETGPKDLKADPAPSFLLSPDAASPRRLLGPLGRIFLLPVGGLGPRPPPCFLFSVFQNARPPTTPKAARPPTDREIKTGRPALPLSPVTREPCAPRPLRQCGPTLPHVPVLGFSRPGAATLAARELAAIEDRHRRARFDGGRIVRVVSISRFLFDSCSYVVSGSIARQPADV